MTSPTTKAEIVKLLAGDWYHGTRHAGPLTPSKMGRQGPGIYLTSLPKEASSYAGKETGAQVHLYKVLVKNPLVVDEAAGENVYETLGVDDDKSLLEALKGGGWDGILSTADDRPAARKYKLPLEDTVGPSFHLVVFDPTLIKEKFSKSKVSSKYRVVETVKGIT